MFPELTALEDGYSSSDLVGFVPTVTADAVRYERAEQQACNFIDKNIKLIEASILSIKAGADMLTEPLKTTFDYAPFF